MKVGLKENVLIVDDNPANVILLKDLLEYEDYNVTTAKNGLEALDLILYSLPEVILLDIMMPEMDGYEVLDHLMSNEETKYIPVIVVSAKTDESDVKLALDKGAVDYIKKPINNVELIARVRSALRLKRTQDQLRLQNEELIRQNLKLERSEQIILTLISAIEAKSPYLEGHSKNVAKIALKIAAYFDISNKDKQLLKQSAYLHDIGKIGTPDGILNKPGKLTPEEFDEIKKHAEMGAKILEPLEKFQQVKNIVRHHHEKLNGTGYPDGIKGEEIDLLTRIISVADVYDALSSRRSYREKLPLDTIKNIFNEEVNKGWWDKEVVNALFKIIG
ncbi:MAG: HD domain-containing phosphohydrolase [Cyanobacteriota bacterium]